MRAACHNYTETVRVLLKQGAKINLQCPKKVTALMLAAAHGCVDTVNVLLAQGAEINLQDEFGRTALMYAASFGQTKTALVLLAQGANISLQDWFGRTAFMLASSAYRQETVEAIEEHLVYPARKKEMELTFTFFSEKRKLSEEKRPEVYLQKDLIAIIDDYVRPASIPVPKKT